ncbi:Putative peptidoglycan binding domain-containing protein [Saccharopolyspora kobensis]|uniref:Peptidoglycan binding domain-containing protein n=2 Tax=Saccharopolyspora kobensis TaxID=146035 RepID=A0A1H6DFE5_9PSEU|nr:Putative peptidoglycan binding domain-containing protein [Saccharopolyspora kobensis]SFE33659.1 Putative peptidoglycan binding domain-containing protein [Saccharopolyspora kobensis]
MIMSIGPLRLVAALAMAVLVFSGVSATTAPEAAAYDWSRELREGDSGADVTELQIRVAGWAADGAEQTFVAVDGKFGPGTKAAVARFQKAYGLDGSGVVDGATQEKLNALEEADGSTAHFEFAEFHSKDGAGFGGGNADESTVRENVRRLMYKLEAIREKAGDAAITVNSGFRSKAHNENVGGAANSQHTYGIAADIVISGKSVSQTIDLAKTSGMSGIIRYNTFTHVDSRMEYPYGTQYWYWKV